MKRYKLARLARPDRSSLRERLTVSRTAADRVLGSRQAGEVTGQPESERLTTGASVEGGATTFRESASAQHHGQRELGADLNRAGAEGGGRGSAETDMGRHESFDPTTSVLASVSVGRSLRAAALRPALPIEPGLAEACAAQVERLKHWDDHPGSLNEEEGDAEMDRWGAVFRRAIDEPSAGLSDLAAKAKLMQSDMDRFLPVDEYSGDNYRLMRVILDEIATLAANQPISERTAFDSVGLAIDAHRSARAALTAACKPADSVWVEQNGGDTSEEAMAPARAIHEAASDAETDAWDALLETRPSDADGLLRMLRYIASAGPMEVLGDARGFGRNIVEAAEAALMPSIDANAELVALGWQFDRLHAAWLDAVEAAREPGERFDAVMAVAKARGGPTMKDIEALWSLPGVRETHDAEDGAYAALCEVANTIMGQPARTAQDLAVQARAVIPSVWPGGTYKDDAARGHDEDVDKEAVRALIESCCAFAGVDWRGRPQASAPLVEPACSAGMLDPIHSLIAEHRAAYAEWDQLSAITGNMLRSDPGFAAAEEAAEGPGKREIALLNRLVAAQPTTLGGILALAEYLPSALRQVDPNDHEPDSEIALRNIAAALRCLCEDGRLALDIDTAITGRLKTTYLKGAA